VVVFGGALLITALVIGGLTQVSRKSGPYTSQMNRSFASQVTVLAESSNVTSTSVRSLLADMSNESRQSLQAELDSVVQQTAQQDDSATTFATPAPPGPIAQNFAYVFSDRAAAVSQLRGAIDGLLGMHPLPVAGSSSGNADVVSTPTLLTSSQATSRITAAVALLRQSDQRYAAVRRDLARSPGHPRVPASVWVSTSPVWLASSAATQVDEITTSSSLAAVPQLVLTSVRLSPAALPSPTGAVTPGTSTLSPTNSLMVSVVLSNQGSVDEPRATAHITLTTVTTGHTVALTRVVALAASRSVTLDPASFIVRPGRSYQLSVAIDLPQAQTATANTSVSELLQIAPNLPPTTTTTSTTTVTTTTVKK
jgi:hypothetical protein